MKVLSLFDGISIIQQAFKELDIEIDAYVSEIDQYAISITQKNHPNTKQLGNVKNIKLTNNLLSYNNGDTIKINQPFDLVCGGSPCQDLSIAKASRLGLEGERSGLFWEYVRILNEVKPKYFILENVASMSRQDRDKITQELGVVPILLNTNLVSAQNRKRLFWTNIPNIQQPNDASILLRDILEAEAVEEKYFMTKKQIETVLLKKSYAKHRAYNIKEDKKIGTLTVARNVKRIILADGNWRYLTPIEYERLQSLPDDYTKYGINEKEEEVLISNTQRYKTLSNGFNCAIIKHIIKNMS